MAGRVLALGEASATKFRKRGDRFRAEAMVRLFNGQRVTVSATGGTKREAENKLRETIDHRLGRPIDTKAIKDLTPLYVVAGQFFTQAYLEADQADRAGARKRQSVDSHAQVWKSHLRPHLAEITLSELTPRVLEHVLNQIRLNGSEAKAKRAYTTLNLILKRAQLHGGILVNPLTAVPKPRPKPKAVVALDAHSVGQVRAAVRRYDLVHQQRARRQGGPAPTGDLAAVLDVLFGTGLRISEALALRWCDIVREDGKWWVDVNATLVQIKGRGIVRQDTPKTAASDRLVPLPLFAAEAIFSMRRNADEVEPVDYVFPAQHRSGHSVKTPRSRSNWSRSLRAALAMGGLGDIGFAPHVARKTVATVVARATGSEEIAGKILGHQTSRTVTALHYIERMREAPDETEVIQAFIDLSETLVPLPGPRFDRGGAPIVIQP
jgi:integrase